MRGLPQLFHYLAYLVVLLLQLHILAFYFIALRFQLCVLLLGEGAVPSLCPPTAQQQEEGYAGQCEYDDNAVKKSRLHRVAFPIDVQLLFQHFYVIGLYFQGFVLQLHYFGISLVGYHTDRQGYVLIQLFAFKYGKCRLYKPTSICGIDEARINHRIMNGLESDLWRSVDAYYAYVFSPS